MSDPVEFLDLDDLVDLAIALLGDPAPIRDIGLLGSAVARPQTTAFGEDAYPDKQRGIEVQRCLTSGCVDEPAPTVLSVPKSRPSSHIQKCLHRSRVPGVSTSRKYGRARIPLDPFAQPVRRAGRKGRRISRPPLALRREA